MYCEEFCENIALLCFKRVMCVYLAKLYTHNVCWHHRWAIKHNLSDLFACYFVTQTDCRVSQPHFWRTWTK